MIIHGSIFGILGRIAENLSSYNGEQLFARFCRTIQKG